MIYRGWGYTASRGYETMASVAAGRGVCFSSSSLGLSCAFSCIWACGQLTGVFSWAVPEHRSLLIVEEVDGGGRAWGLKRPTWVEFFIVPGEDELAQKTRDVMGVFFGHHLPKPLCSMVVQASNWSIPLVELLPHSHSFRMFPHSQPQSSAWVCCPEPTFQHPALVCSGGRASHAGWAGQGSGPRVQVSLYPAATRWLPCPLPMENEVLLPSKLSSPSEGLPQIWRPLLTFISPRIAGPNTLPLRFLFLLFSFPSFSSCFFYPTWPSRNLVFLDFEGSLLVFSRALWELFHFLFIWAELISTSA